MTVLRKAYVKVEPDTKGFDPALKEQLRRSDPGGKAGRDIGTRLNGALKRVHLDPINIKVDPKSALAEIALTEGKLRQLSHDAATVEVKVHAEKALGELGRFRKQLGHVGDDAGPKAAAGFASRFGNSLGPLLGSAFDASPLIAGIALAGVAAAPVLIPAVSAALSAGIGAGVLGAGLALAAKDPIVAQRGKEFGANFVAALQHEASTAFQGPLLASLDKLEAFGRRTTVKLGKAFADLAPSIGPLFDKLIISGDRLGDSLTRAASGSGPALAALGDSIVLLSDGMGDFIDLLTKGGPEAASNLRLVAGATADLLRWTGLVLAAFNKLSNSSLFTGPLIALMRKHYDDLAKSGDKAATSTTGLTRVAEKFGPVVQRALPPQASLVAALADGTREANNQRTALSNLARQMRAQTDPVFALLTAEEDLKTAQHNAAQAIKDHGRKSIEARTATRNLALAALDLQGKVGDLGASFTGKLTPQMIATFKAAHLTDRQIEDVAKQFRVAKRDADIYDGAYAARVSAPGAVISDRQIRSAYLKALDFDGTYRAFMQTPGGKQAETQADKAWNKLKGFDGDWVAHISTTGYSKVAGDLRHLLASQQALKEGISVNEANRELGHFFATGGWTGPGPKRKVAGTVHADEFVVQKNARQPLERTKPGALDYMNRTGRWPGYAGGGIVLPFPTNVKGTKIPAMDFGGPSGGGMTYKFIEAVVRAAFPGMRVISDFRAGARTLSGNRSYHALGRAVDFPPSLALAEWINLHFRARTKELITPWNNLNIHNGARHAYTGAIFRQHNFAGGNAHDHWAMANGGVISEPVWGVGASGRTYSFGERGPETVTPGVGGDIHVHIHNSVVTSKRAAVDLVVDAVQTAKRERRLP